MNSQWPIGPLPKPPSEYDAEYMNKLVNAIAATFTRARATGPLEVQTINVSQLPTSSAGLRSGDLWNDSGTVKVV